MCPSQEWVTIFLLAWSIICKVLGFSSKKGYHTSIRYRCQKQFDSDACINDL